MVKAISNKKGTGLELNMI